MVPLFSAAPYIKPCSRNDPNFNECAVKHGNEAIPHLIKGKCHNLHSFDRDIKMCSILLSLLEGLAANIRNENKILISNLKAAYHIGGLSVNGWMILTF
jgi:hypothetical protein